MKKGETVYWKWSKSAAEGKVLKKFTDPVSRAISTDVKRNASTEEPAYLIRQEDGSEVLKSESALIKSNIK